MSKLPRLGAAAVAGLMLLAGCGGTPSNNVRKDIAAVTTAANRIPDGGSTEDVRSALEQLKRAVTKNATDLGGAKVTQLDAAIASISKDLDALDAAAQASPAPSATAEPSQEPSVAPPPSSPSASPSPVPSPSPSPSPTQEPSQEPSAKPKTKEPKASPSVAAASPISVASASPARTRSAPTRAPASGTATAQSSPVRT